MAYERSKGRFMSYVVENLVPGEKLLYQGEFHWFYTVSSGLSLLLSALFALWIYYYPPVFLYSFLNTGVFTLNDAVVQVNQVLAFLFFIYGAYQYFMRMMMKNNTEIAVTDRRIIYKRGVIGQYIKTIDRGRVEGVDIYQSVLGRILDMGRVHVRDFGHGGIRLPVIKKPNEFRKALIGY